MMLRKLALALLLLVAPLAHADTLRISTGGYIQTFNGTFTALDTTAHTLAMDWTSTSTVSGSLTTTGLLTIWTVELHGGGEDSTQHFYCKWRLQTLVSGPNLTLVCSP